VTCTSQAGIIRTIREGKLNLPERVTCLEEY
jgi:hypothetical protein